MTQAQVTAEAPGVPVVQAEAITKSFGQNVVLDGIDLEVVAGEALVVIGPSGSGKSTSSPLLTSSSRSTGGASSSRARRSRAKAPRWLRSRQRIGSCSSSSPSSPPEGDRQRHAGRAPRARKTSRREAEARGRASCSRAWASTRSRSSTRTSSRAAPAAGRDCAGADDGAAGDALRRGHLGARSRARAEVLVVMRDLAKRG